MESDAGSCDVFQLWCASMMRKGEKKMKMVFCFMLTMTLCLNCFAKDNVESNLPKAEVVEVEAFFKEFKEAFNAKDAERVRKMSGKTWEKWSENMEENYKIESIDIKAVNKDRMISVTTKTSAIDKNGSARSDEVVFTLGKYAENYAIEKMTVPEVAKRNQSMRDAVSMTKKFVASINNKDLSGVKDALVIGDVLNFETELSARGLSWIKDALSDNAKVRCEGVGWEGNGCLVGDVYVCSASGGTNVLQRFIFKDGKIDRAAPRPETREERLARIGKEDAEMRKRLEAYEKRMAEEDKRAMERAFEAIRKGERQQQRNGAGAK